MGGQLIEPTTLVARRADALAHNAAQLQALPGEARVLAALDAVEVDEVCLRRCLGPSAAPRNNKRLGGGVQPPPSSSLLLPWLTGCA